MTSRFVSLALGLLLCGACGDESTGGSEGPVDLGEGLGSAHPGDTITVFSRSYETVEIPPGVTVVVDGGARVTIAGKEPTDVALRVRTAAGSVTHVSGLSIESRGAAAIMITGDGEAVIEDASIDCYAGLGIVADGQAKVTLRRVTLRAVIANPQGLKYPIELSSSRATRLSAWPWRTCRSCSSMT